MENQTTEQSSIQQAPAPGSFEAEFNRRVDDIISRAYKVGLTVTDLCKRTKTARATPDRWRKEAPLSIKLVDKLEAEVVAAEHAAGQ